MNTTSEITTPDSQSIEDVIAKTVIEGDLSRLSPRERVLYYNAVCRSLGLNPLNQRYDKWLAIYDIPKNIAKQRVLCLCDCGTMRTVFKPNLLNGTSRSCGCSYRIGNTKHGLKQLPEYRVWKSLKNRCYNPSCKSYKDYGGRGITISLEWNDFAIFYRDMGSRPSPEHEIDRIDNDGPYCKENTRWVTRTENANNKRSNRLFTIDGETKTMTEWCRTAGITRSAFKARLKNGWLLQDIIHTPLTVRNRKKKESLDD